MTFDPGFDDVSRQMIVVPPEIGRAVGEPPGSSRRSTQVVKKYDELQSRETLPVSRPRADTRAARNRRSRVGGTSQWQPHELSGC